MLGIAADGSCDDAAAPMASCFPQGIVWESYAFPKTSGSFFHLPEWLHPPLHAGRSEPCSRVSRTFWGPFPSHTLRHHK